MITGLAREQDLACLLALAITRVHKFKSGGTHLSIHSTFLKRKERERGSGDISDLLALLEFS